MYTPSRSLWDSNEPTMFPTLNEDLLTDVIIIGAGITGVTAALRLAEAGKRVVVLEARTVCSGVTGYTTAHITEDLDAGYADVRSTFGAPAAKGVAQSVRAAIDHIGSRVAELRIDCDLAYVPAYSYCEQASEVAELHEELDACREAGIFAELTHSVPLPYPTAAAIKYTDQACFHPTSYVRGLLSEAVRRGVRVYENSRVISIAEGEPCEVKLENGVHVGATAVFCATHVPLNRLLLQTKLAHTNSYVVAYKQTPIADALFYDHQQPYHYLRLATIAGERYFLLGGADHQTGEQLDTRLPFEQLIEFGKQRFGLGEPDLRWSAELHTSIDGLPLIGRNAASRHVYVATGLAGDGMTFGTVAGLLVSDLILGRDNAWTELYDATRITPSSIGEFFRENAKTPRHLLGDRLKGSDVDSLAEIERGDGKIVRRGGHRLAVHRDATGELHAVSAICTHMGCVVKFNRAEATWDCPCHGSRFTVDGRVIEGPAMQALPAHPVADEPAALKKLAT